MNQKEKDILEANPVLGRPDLAEQLAKWEERENEKRKASKGKTPLSGRIPGSKASTQNR